MKFCRLMAELGMSDELIEQNTKLKHVSLFSLNIWKDSTELL